jgi:transposase
MAIKYLHEKKSRKEVMKLVGCTQQTLITWVDLFLEKGLSGLVEPITHQKPQRLSLEKKQEIKTMLLEQKPTDYGIDRQIWTGKIICEVIQMRWGIKLKDSRIYEILDELNLSHQKAHRDYENADPVVQKEFVDSLKKNWKA